LLPTGLVSYKTDQLTILAPLSFIAKICCTNDSLLVPLVALRPPIRLPDTPAAKPAGMVVPVNGVIPRKVGTDGKLVEELAVRSSCPTFPLDARCGIQPSVSVPSEIDESKVALLVIQLGSFKGKELLPETNAEANQTPPKRIDWQSRS
jgi:hypothetical protein